MAILVKVDGGTGAGRKTLRQAEKWKHTCLRANDGDPLTLEWFIELCRAGKTNRTLNTYSCPDCGVRRNGLVAEQAKLLTWAIKTVASTRRLPSRP